MQAENFLRLATGVINLDQVLMVSFSRSDGGEKLCTVTFAVGGVVPQRVQPGRSGAPTHAVEPYRVSFEGADADLLATHFGHDWS